MSNDNFWLSVMLLNFFGKKQNNGNQNKGGCLSSLIGWIIIAVVISIITTLRKPVGRVFIKIRLSFIYHPVMSWAITAVVLVVIAFVIGKIKKIKKDKLIKNESESISEEVNSDSVDE